MTRPSPPAETDLIRLAVAITQSPTARSEAVQLADGIATVGISAPIPYGPSGTLSVMTARRPLVHFPAVSGGRIVVPHRERSQLEDQIEHCANLLTISERAHHEISSPPEQCVYFDPRSERARLWFASFDEIVEPPDNESFTSMSAPIDLEVVAPSLDDRTDGVALLAEAYATAHATSRFRELVRVFERAFARPPIALPELVVRTVDSSLGYEVDETFEWFSKRDGASHADQRNRFVLAADVLRYLPRMEQAALDILINKAAWRSPSTDRRSTWTLRAGTTCPQGSRMFALQGTANAQTTVRWFDTFGRFPRNFTANLDPAIPETWWPN